MCSETPLTDTFKKKVHYFWEPSEQKTQFQ